MCSFPEDNNIKLVFIAFKSSSVGMNVYVNFYLFFMMVMMGGSIQHSHKNNIQRFCVDLVLAKRLVKFNLSYSF